MFQSQLLAVVLGSLAAPVPVQDEKDIPLPPPREVRVETVEVQTILPPPGNLRPSRYAVWQLYSVDQRGQFRPRVVDTPYGAYYLYNGQPFPWSNLQETWYRQR